MLQYKECLYHGTQCWSTAQQNWWDSLTWKQKLFGCNHNWKDNMSNCYTVQGKGIFHRRCTKCGKQQELNEYLFVWQHSTNELPKEEFRK